MQPRRLDCLFLKNLNGSDGEVLQQRDLACSEHEPVHLQLHAKTVGKTGKPYNRPNAAKRCCRGNLGEERPPPTGRPTSTYRRHRHQAHRTGEIAAQIQLNGGAQTSPP